MDSEQRTGKFFNTVEPTIEKPKEEPKQEVFSQVFGGITDFAGSNKEEEPKVKIELEDNTNIAVQNIAVNNDSFSNPVPISENVIESKISENTPQQLESEPVLESINIDYNRINEQAKLANVSEKEEIELTEDESKATIQANAKLTRTLNKGFDDLMNLKRNKY